MTEDHPPAGAAAPPSPSPKTGADVIAGYLKTLPQTPGVYRMLDAAGDVILPRLVDLAAGTWTVTGR